MTQPGPYVLSSQPFDRVKKLVIPQMPWKGRRTECEWVLGLLWMQMMTRVVLVVGVVELAGLAVKWLAGLAAMAGE